MKMHAIISRVRIVINVLLSTLNKKVCKNKTVIIVFQQIFGDSILIQSSLEAYTKLYPKNEGYNLIFLARPSILKFMKDVMPIPEDITYEELDYKKFLSDYKYYRLIINSYKNKAGTIVVPVTSLSAEIFTCSVNAKRKIGLVRSIDLKKPFIYAYISKIAYNETVRPAKEDMMLQRHRELIRYLGLTDYKSRLPILKEKDRIISGKYAVICPGSSKAEKCWSIDKYASISNYLIEKFELDIHLCGAPGEEEYANQLKNKVKHSEKIISHIGKTSFSEWSSIIQHARIVIGNDSATVHMSVAARVPSICIAGVYDKNLFFPYQVDILEDGDLLPQTIIKDQSCEWCRTRGYNAGYGNSECKKAIKQGKSSLCIEKISESKVIEAIDNILFLNHRDQKQC